MGLKTNKKVIIYIKNGCKTCHDFSAWLNSIGMKHETVEIMQNREEWEAAKEEGQIDGVKFASIPTIMIVDGDKRTYFNMPRDFKKFEQGRVLIQNELLKGL